MTVELDNVFLAFNIGMTLFGLFAGVAVGWLLHTIRIDRNTERAERAEDERQKQHSVVATDA